MNKVLTLIKNRNMLIVLMPPFLPNTPQKPCPLEILPHLIQVRGRTACIPHACGSELQTSTYFGAFAFILRHGFFSRTSTFWVAA